MVHFDALGTSSTISFDGRDNVALVTYTETGAPCRVELPYRSTCTVLPTGASLTALGFANGLDIRSHRVIATLLGPIGEETAAGPAMLATTQSHPEAPSYMILGLVGELRNGEFTATQIAWTFHSLNGLTGDSSIPIDAVIISSSGNSSYEVAWRGYSE